MDIRQLRYFTAIAEEGQISLAAKKLNMAQPPLSQQLQLMEEELGVKLVERKRNGKKMELTEAGRVLYEKAQSVLHLFSESIKEVKEIGEGLQGTLSIGVVPSCVSYLPNRIQCFHQRFPLVSFKIWGGDPYEIRKHLEYRKIELAIVRFPLEMKGLSMVQLKKEPFVFVAPKVWKTFPLSEKISLIEIKDIPLLLTHRTKGEGVYEKIIEECNRFAFHPTVLCHCPDVNILLSLVASGVGASILPKSSIPAFLNEDVNVLEIVDSSLQSDIALIWLENRYISKAARSFIECFN
ncbi:LysR family transcriptional regulator [Bacillus sp. EB600]|uniref:LysR family transcriptional regulator n=1 Tax=Bacillus sp. EB600 TaxID=2806345 RepID=UPI002108757E|nr:LysR family transcriptional regulator [Bacillus sp. EB600]MCQ6280764.1 LysR family transcriptional regulator [Bacillus sp. EB600]